MIARNIVETAIRKDNSGINLGAQTTKLLQVENMAIPFVDMFMAGIDKRKDISITDKAVIELLYTYGLRISEAIDIKSTDVAPTGQIFIKTKKTGQTRIVVPVRYTTFWTNTARLSLPLSQIYSRFYYYRLFKKMGYYKRYGQNEKNSVTHYFRHELVKTLEAAGFSREAVALFLAHRGMQSIAFYEQ